MSELKTKPTSQKAEDFLNTIELAEKRSDGFALLEMFKKITGEKAVMWGSSSSYETNRKIVPSYEGNKQMI